MKHCDEIAATAANKRTTSGHAENTGSEANAEPWFWISRYYGKCHSTVPILSTRHCAGLV